MKKAIVIGATGLIGQSLLEELAVDNTFGEVLAITRRPVNFRHHKIINQVVEFDNLANFSHLLKGDVLFSCLGTTKKQAGSISAQRLVDVDYQLKAAEIAAANGVAEYFLVSSSGANAASSNAYLRMKGELEEKVAQLTFKRICIFQPSLLLGERAGFRLAEKLAGWILPTLCTLPFLTRYKPIYGSQIAKKMRQECVKRFTGIHVFTLDECFPSE